MLKPPSTYSGQAKVIAIVGPTSSGKSSLGVLLAKKFNGEIISADSRQVYRGLNIGTGKISKKEMRGIPHYLLDVVSPKKQFNADDFVRLARNACSSILQKARMPIVVGGTGFYVDALLGRITLPNVPPNAALRAQLEKKSAAQLFAMLKNLDPRRVKTVEPKHKRRLIRAIEIAKALGKSPPYRTSDVEYDVLWIGLNPKNLKQKIHARLSARIKSGMIAEAKRLHEAGLSYKRMDELGLEYRYLALYLQKKLTYEQMLEQLERAIGRYAKRQSRWFKRNPEIVWIKSKNEAARFAKKFLS
ncbi:MAG: tRNA (adenosine(37)-N6)-dimethylallyltransferase MiaA [Patescibacteria group bacterium]